MKKVLLPVRHLSAWPLAYFVRIIFSTPMCHALWTNWFIQIGCSLCSSLWVLPVFLKNATTWKVYCSWLRNLLPSQCCTLCHGHISQNLSWIFLFVRYIAHLSTCFCPYSSIYQSGELPYTFCTRKINKTYNFPCSIVSKVTVSKVTLSESDSRRLTRKRTGGPQSVRYIRLQWMATWP